MSPQVVVVFFFLPRLKRRQPKKTTKKGDVRGLSDVLIKRSGGSSNVLIERRCGLSAICGSRKKRGQLEWLAAIVRFKTDGIGIVRI